MDASNTTQATRGEGGSGDNGNTTGSGSAGGAGGAVAEGLGSIMGFVPPATFLGAPGAASRWPFEGWPAFHPSSPQLATPGRRH